MTRFYLTTAAALLALAQLSACVPLAIGGAATTTALVATDRRTAGEQVDDKSINIKVNMEASKILDGKPGRVDGSSYAGQVLLVGDVPSAEDSQRIATAVEKIDSVKEVINRLRVGAVTALSVRSNDGWITTKVTTALINTKDVPSRTISVTTERGVVYLQGLVTKEEGDLAARAASTVPGVNKVVKLFQYVSAERSLLPKNAAPSATTEQNQSSTSTTPESAANSNEPEVFKIE